MKFYDEIAKIARELYEKSGRIEGRDLDNWLEAERIVMLRHKEEKIPEVESSYPLKKKSSATIKKASRKRKKAKKTNE